MARISWTVKRGSVWWNYMIKYYVYNWDNKNINLMISFEQQSKLLNPLLQKPTNKKCADCGSGTPTWASLDFGVFVCSNCSGAHRALGPTVTRIKSTTLDQWNRAWLSNMVLGNNEINEFWEADATAAALKKPKLGAPLDQYNRYVRDKYIKRKYAKDQFSDHPLKAYKNGNQPTQHTIQEEITQKKSITVVCPPSNKPRSQNFSLLDGDDQVPSYQPQIQGNGFTSSVKNEVGSNQVEPDEDEFDDFVEAVPPQVHSSKSSDPKELCFDDLFNKPKLESHHSQQQAPNYSQGQAHQNISNGYSHPNNHMNYMNSHQNMHLNPQANRNFHSAMHQQQWNQNYAHNPYVGYNPQQHSMPHKGPYSNFTLN